MTAPVKPLRSDAARNLERVLAAARQLVAERGAQVGMEEIAAAAGVGVGTLYRRFPSKSALVDALMDDLVRQLVESGRTLIVSQQRGGLESWLRSVAQTFATHRGCLPQLWHPTRRAPAADDVRSVLAALLVQAKQYGDVGEHVELGDLYALLWALRGIIEITGEAAPHAWQRHLDLHLVGLRSTEAVSSRPALTTAQLSRIARLRASS